MPVPETIAARLVVYTESNVAKDARAYTDEHKSYSGLENHETVNHGDGEYVRGDVHINGMEPVWALIRLGYNGTYHRIEDKHLHRYINEFTGRLNMRALSTVDKMRKMVRGWVDKRFTYKQLVAGSVLCSNHNGESGPHPPLHPAWLPPSTRQALYTTGNKRSCCPNKSRMTAFAGQTIPRVIAAK